jgi:SAM-dependent methyltransferase
MEWPVKLIAHSPNLLVNEERPGPRTIERNGRTWYRFMDYLYVPTPPAEMEPELVKEVCELRLLERNRVLDQRLHDTVQSAMIDLIRDSGIAPNRILDFGTGSGEAIEVLRAFTPSVLGCDMSAKTLATAQRPNTVVVAPEGSLPFITGAFDLVHALFVMHFKVPTSMVRELRRCLALGGFLVANCYGDGVEPYREQLRRAGWDLTESRAVTGVVSHVVDLWRPGDPRAHARRRVTDPADG